MPVVTLEAARKRLRDATNREELERVAHLIQFVPGISDRETLSVLFKKRADEFKENAQCSH